MTNQTGEPDWYGRTAAEAAELLETTMATGLAEAEAAARLRAHGPNELPAKSGPGLASLLAAQLKDFLILLLIGAAAVAAVFGKWLDAGVVLAVVVLNATLGVSQELRAEKALAALRRLAAPMATVVRGGRTMRVPARELVLGDLVALEAGDLVPADLRLVSSHNLRVDESALTGESVPVEKQADAVFAGQVALGDRRNSAFSSTVVTYGRGRGLVVATGPHTQIGLIAGMLAAIEAERTPLQKALDRLGRALGYATLVICGLVFATGISRGGDFLTLFMTAVSLAVAAVPEGLPAVVTIVLSTGMQRMVEKNVIIRHLPAVETLGSTTVICSDKTGTLTQNQMTVVRIWAAGRTYLVDGEGYRPRGGFHLAEAAVDADETPGRPITNPLDDGILARCLTVGTLCNDAQLESSGEAVGDETCRIVGDPTEGALVVAARKAGLAKSDAEGRSPRVAEVPFDSARKRMSTLHQLPDGRIMVCVKGAPDVLLRQCDRAVAASGEELLLDDAGRDRILAANQGFAGEALRVLGLTAMVDPVRPEAAQAVALCREAGIEPVMITGDYRDTAVAVGRDLGLAADEGAVVTGDELARMSQEELVEQAKDASIYARVAPEDKVRIVDALKRGSGHIVAMTGDGVNDALALKRADIGVAMGITGTDVAKETADMVLTDDNFASIVSAVAEGRRIFANIRKFVFFLLSCNAGEVMIVFFTMLVGLPLPLRPVHLLWLNLVSDGLPALALGVEKAEPDIMRRPPRDPREPIIDRPMRRDIAVQATVQAIATIIAFVWAWRGTGDLVFAQTIAFSTLVLSELLRVYPARSPIYNVWQIGLATNRQLVLATLTSFAMLLALLYVPGLNVVFGLVPLTLGQWGLIGGLALAPAVAAEATKLIARQSRPGPGPRRKKPGPSSPGQPPAA